METAEFLAGVALFKHIEPELLEHLAARMQLLSLPEGPIVREGDPADGLYIIKSGVIKVTTASPQTGAEAVLAILHRGDAFGEVALIDGLPRCANVTAMQPVECYFFPRADFLAELEEHHRSFLSSSRLTSYP